MNKGGYFTVLFMSVTDQLLDLLRIELTDFPVRVLVASVFPSVTAGNGRHMDPVLLFAVVYLLELVGTDVDRSGQVAMVSTV